MSFCHNYSVTELKNILNNGFSNISQCTIFCFNFILNTYNHKNIIEEDTHNFYDYLYDSIKNGRCFMTYIVGIKQNLNWEEIQIPNHLESKINNFSLNSETLEKFKKLYIENEMFFKNFLKKETIHYQLLLNLFKELNISQSLNEPKNLNLKVERSIEKSEDLPEILPMSYKNTSERYNVDLENLILLIKRYYDEDMDLKKENFNIELNSEKLIKIVNIFYEQIATDLKKKYVNKIITLLEIFLKEGKLPLKIYDNFIENDFYMYTQILNRKSNWLSQLMHHFLKKGWTGENIKPPVICNIFRKLQEMVIFG